MKFRIAQSFIKSFLKLTTQEQKKARSTTIDLFTDQARVALRLHRLSNTRDRNLFSVRVNTDIRIITHKSKHGLTLCYVNHHDKAYQWATRHKLATHPETKAMQIVQLQDLDFPCFYMRLRVQNKQPQKHCPLFQHCTDNELLSYGIPTEWLTDVGKADEKALIGLIEHLPEEATNALLEIAHGGTPYPRKAYKPSDPFEHPDAKRRFWRVNNLEQLEKKLMVRKEP